MSQAVEQILDAALPLTSGERAEIVTRLIRSLDGPSPTPEEQAAIDGAWRHEIRRRVSSIQDGTAEWVPGEQVMEKLRRRAAGGQTAGEPRP